MKGGMVVTIRVSPKDCQSILDVIDKANIPHVGQSFPAMVSLALGSLLERARLDSVIPEPDEYQYLNRLQPYMKGSRSKKLAVAKTLTGMGANLQAPPLPASRPEPQAQVAGEHAPPSPTAPASAYSREELREAGQRLAELIAKREAIDDGADMLWQESDQAEYDKYYAIVYPDG